MVAEPAQAIKIFYCYAHEDRALRDELEKHLTPLKRMGQITEWHDRDIQAGTNWAQEIKTHLNTANIILLLVSSDFINSDYCWSIEMKRALERHRTGEARVIPIILRRCDWEETPIGELQALPPEGKPISQWADRDEAFWSVARGVRETVRLLLTQMQQAEEERMRKAAEEEQARQAAELLEAAHKAKVAAAAKEQEAQIARIAAEQERIRKATEETIPLPPQPEFPGQYSPTGPPVVIVSQSQVLIVSKDKSGTHSTISEAIKDARPKTQIHVRPGNYKENIVIDKEVDIIGEGPRRDIVIESSAPCVEMQADYAIVRGLTLRGKPKLLSKYKPAVDIPQGRLMLTDCEISSETLVCIRISGSKSSPTIKHCDIHDGRGNGIEFTENAQGTVLDCKIYRLQETAVEIRQGSTPTIRSCRIHNNNEQGILVSTNARGRIEDCDIYSNGILGVRITQGGNPVLHGCKIFDGRSGGILIADNGQGTIVNCMIYSNVVAGIDIRRASNPTIRECKVYDGKLSGISIDEGGGTIEDCDIYGNTDAGIKIKHSGNPTIRRCQIHDGQGHGLSFDENGGGRVEKCKIFGNAKAGVDIRQAGNPVIQGCEITHNGYGGVRVRENSRATIENCDLRDNTVKGVSVDASSYVDSKGNRE